MLIALWTISSDNVVTIGPIIAPRAPAPGKIISVTTAVATLPAVFVPIYKCLFICVLHCCLFFIFNAYIISTENHWIYQFNTPIVVYTCANSLSISSTEMFSFWKNVICFFSSSSGISHHFSSRSLAMTSSENRYRIIRAGTPATIA